MRRLQKILYSFLLPCIVGKQGFALQFYDRTISFYDNGSKIDSNTKQFQNILKHNGDSGNEIRSLDKQPFSWQNYADPSNVQFWDSGGDFVPSLPWRYLASNPTEDNVQKYIEWENKKLNLSTDLQKKIALNAPQHTAEQITASNKEIPKENIHSSINWKEYEIDYFYQTSCHFCQNSNGIYEYLSQHGAKIIPVQIDWDRNPPAHNNSVKYDKKIDDNFHISVTPTWVLKSKYGSDRIDGFATLDQIEEKAFLLTNKK